MFFNVSKGFDQYELAFSISVVILGMCLCAQANTCTDADADGTPAQSIAFLQAAKTDLSINPDCIEIAIDNLYKVESSDAINILVEYLDFRTPHFDEQLIWSAHLAEYPVIDQLFAIGQPALPFLTRALSENHLGSVARNNALQTVMLIYRENPPAAIEFILKEADRTDDNSKIMNLLQAASDAVQMCYGDKRNKCEAILTLRK